jgi:hypothetical protein
MTGKFQFVNIKKKNKKSDQENAQRETLVW